MEENEIRKYAALMKELNLTGVEIADGDKSLKLYMAPPAPAAFIQPPMPAQKAEAEEAAAFENDFDTVASPMIGIFYAAPAENAEPYVKVGDKIKKGDTLCIIEAMKLMNEITAEYEGIIEEICVSDGATVDFGAPLFKVRR